MQILETIELRRSNEFKKVTGALFCKNCGTEYNEGYFKEMSCPICKSHEFLSGEFANALSGYLKLDDNLKAYYKEKYGKKSSIKMNNKRIILWMMIKEGYMRPDDKKSEVLLNTIMWKRF